ncbi:MAG TPA: hypothetical protein GXX19_12825 [Syntrophomonadaceae bacterium]|nr:hypothetical protein [Syntrophomonadaceae bacterium]
MQNLLNALLNAWQSNSADLTFLQSRWRDFVNANPVETLDATFFNMYQNHPTLLTFSQLRSFFLPQVPHILNGLIPYIQHLGDSRNQGFDSEPIHFVTREVRCLCREAMLYALNNPKTSPQTRANLLRALNLLRITQFNYENLSFGPEEVLVNLPFYLKKADVLAELPQFLPVIFTTDELKCFKTPLSTYHFTEDDEIVLEKLLVTARKKHILQTLKHFVLTYPIEDYTKKAFAIYISLGEIVPWAKHSFIRRLLAVSYQESRVLAITKNNREGTPLHC